VRFVVAFLFVGLVASAVVLTAIRIARRGTARLRLTLLYSGLFLLLSTVAVAVTYGFTSGSAAVDAVAVVPAGDASAYGPFQGFVPVAPTPPKPAKAPQLPVKARRLLRSYGITVPAVTVSPPIIKIPSPTELVKEGVSAQRSADLGKLAAASWFTLALAAIASALLGWFAAGRVLRPLRTITNAANSIGAGSLHQRLALTGPDDEFKALGDTLDSLLARLEAAFDAQRRFVANASHELRTPLTLDRTLLQLALSDPNADIAKLRETCQELLESGRGQERLLEALLTLASSERGLDRREQVDIRAAVQAALQARAQDVQELGLTVAESLEPALATGDPALLQRLAANLIDNAVVHNVEGGRVEVATSGGDGGAELRVANSGRVIAPDRVDGLFEAFERLGTRRATGGEGHGLGLSIVRAIAEAHGAKVSAEALAGGGLAVTVSFGSAPTV
jgi:signal transduction histidine kinase